MKEGLIYIVYVVVFFVIAILSEQVREERTRNVVATPSVDTTVATYPAIAPMDDVVLKRDFGWQYNWWGLDSVTADSLRGNVVVVPMLDK